MNPTNFPYIAPSLRAQCVRVIDGDTVDLFTDEGKHHYALHRYRLLGIDTFELNDPDPLKRDLAKAAKDKLTEWCCPVGTAINLDKWPLRVVTHKADSFGRWLVHLYWIGADGVEKNAAEELFAAGLAVPYKTGK